MGLFENKKVLIYGKGKSGTETLKFLVGQGAQVTIVDDKDLAEGKIIRLKKIDFAVISPGIAPSKPLVKMCREEGVPTLSEMEFASLFVKGELFAITGTNGKTTTTTLLGQIFAEKGNSVVAGNIGTPLVAYHGQTNKKTKIALEVSSFQLELCKDFCPHYCALLNLAPDHIDRHKTVEDYYNCKAKIFQNQTKKDFLVVNADDEKCVKICAKARSKKFYFSAAKKVVGTFVLDNNIYFAKKHVKFAKKVVNLADFCLIGAKNVENLLAAICLACLGKVKIKHIQNAVKKMVPLENRLEDVGTFGAVRYINDSKATNIASTLADLQSFSAPVVLMLGGSGKGEDYTTLFSDLPSNVRFCVIYGGERKAIEKAASKAKKNFKVVKNFGEAFDTAVENAVSGDTVLLAPACASFDEFDNYEHRGKRFKELVKGLHIDEGADEKN